MFVVVYLKLCKVYVVVPESWIYDVNQELLKNQGVNCNRDVLVFWSKKGLIDDQPNENYAPNFLSNKESTFPPSNNVEEACYVGRLIKYFGE